MNYDQIILIITYRSLIWLTNTICSHNFVLENWYFSIKFRAATAILYVLRPENLVFHWLVRNGSHSYPPNALLKLHVCLSYKLSKQMGGIRLLPKKNVYFVTDIVVHKVSSEQISPLFFSRSFMPSNIFEIFSTKMDISSTVISCRWDTPGPFVSQQFTKCGWGP